MRSYPLALILLVIFSCEQAKPTFQQSVSSDSKPWTHSQFDESPDKLTFAIFSDLTGGEREHIFEVAVEQINLLRPEFIMNVGDLIEGGSTEEEWNEQWDSFDARAKKSIAPLFYTGGNHDLTGVLAQQVWENRLGRRYYHFLYKDVLFLILDTEDHSTERRAEIQAIRDESMEVIKEKGWGAFSETPYFHLHERSTGYVSQEQVDYFLRVIQENPQVRHTFLFMHKPAWEKEDEQQFSQIEKALGEKAYTVFHGHTHFYNHTVRNGHDYINLATTGGVQMPEEGRSMDQIALVTVQGKEVSIANILMQGLLDKTGHIPLGGDNLTFEKK